MSTIDQGMPVSPVTAELSEHGSARSEQYIMGSDVLLPSLFNYELDGKFQRIAELEAENTRLRIANAVMEVCRHRHQAIIDSSIDLAIIVIERDGRIIDWGGGACHILGWSAEEMREERVDRFYTCEDRLKGRFQKEMRLASDQGWAKDEHWYRRKDGSHFWASTELVPLQGEDGSHLGFLNILRDCSLQKLAEAELHARQAHFSAALAIAKLGTFQWNVPNGVLRLDERSREIFGFLPHEGVRAQDIFDRVDSSDAERILTEIQDAQRTSSLLETEYRINLPGGKARNVISISNVIPGTGGNAERVIGVFGDVTARKQTEAALHERNQALEQRDEVRTHELAETEEQLRQSQKMEAVGQLTGGLAHDFNNLLSVISGSLELAQARLAQGQTFDLEHHITAARGAARRAAALTQRLLAFSRQQTLTPQPTDINRLIWGMEALIRRTIGPGIVVETVTNAGLWTTLVDQNQLENALLNLSINAGYAMSNNGQLRIEAANKRLNDETACEYNLPAGDYLSLCVTDTGPGMAPEVIKRAFDPFFTTKPIGQGSGLGLSMVYGFCRQSGGHVRIASEPGHGATICLYLPRHFGEPETVEAPSTGLATAHHSARGETVLIVDDEPTLRELVAEVLNELGYTTIEATDGAAGLKVLQSDLQIDLLVSDIGLPGSIDGLKLAEAGCSIRPGLKVLIITGYADNVAIRTNGPEPAMKLLLKPFTVTALVNQIGELIECARCIPASA